MNPVRDNKSEISDCNRLSQCQKQFVSNGMKPKLVFCFFILFFESLSFSAQSCLPEYLRCEYKVNPLGIDSKNPRLSWIVSSSQKGQKQTAYQVFVASSQDKLDVNIGDLWDSGKIGSDETINIIYEGKPLRSQMQCFWKICIWDKDGKPGWSAPAFWSMGLLEKNDWKAQWIGFDNRPQNVYEKDSDKGPYTFTDCNWICLSRAKSRDLPKGKYLLQKNIRIDPLKRPKNLRLRLAALGRAAVYVNNEKFADVGGIEKPSNLNLIDKLRDGNNIIAIQIESLPDSPDSPALIGKIIYEYINSPSAAFPLDTNCLAVAGTATRLIPYGSPPWGRFDKTRLILPPPAYLRNDFEITKPVKRATVYASALGLYQLYINGSIAGDDYFTPGWTDYEKRVYYNTYDVTQLLHQGKNAVGAILADGWYAGYIGWSLQRHQYGQNTRFIAQISIEYTDGTSQIFATGSDWKASTGPIQFADIIMGQTYDARKEIPGWSSPDFNSNSWQKVDITKSISAPLQSYPGQNVRQFAEIEPVSLKQPLKGVYVYDMGTNFAGFVRLKIKGSAGDAITLRFAERLNPDGTIYTDNLRDARATDVYICKGGQIENWQPQFTYHGFQYVEITGLSNKPDMDTITGIELTSAPAHAGSFQCSDEMANKLYHNICQTQRANFMEIPTDCPQRNERMGWTGDAQVYVATACVNSDVEAFFEKWLTDLRDAQGADGQFPKVAPSKLAGDDGGPAWSDAGVICPWTIYSVYCDKRLLQDSYPSMKRFIDFCKNRSTKDLLPPQKYQCYGDWLNIDDETPKDVIYTAYFAHSTKLTAQAAAALGKDSDAKEYEKLFEKIKSSFNKAYVEPNGAVFGNSQTAYVLAIAFDLLDEPVRSKAGQHLVERIEDCNWHLSTGFVGTKDLLPALSKIGRNDVAYRLFFNDTFPSWGFSIKNGATSIWERWDGWTPENGFQISRMNSFSHYAFGAVGQWMFENIGGIKSDGPGFKKIIIKPLPDGKLTWAKASYNSIRGLIISDWKIEKNLFKLNVSIPANTTATVFLPAENKNGFIPYKVASGNYEFTSHFQH